MVVGHCLKAAKYFYMSLWRLRMTLVVKETKHNSVFGVLHTKSIEFKQKFDINQPFITQEQKFKYWEESKAEIKRLTSLLEEYKNEQSGEQAA